MFDSIESDQWEDYVKLLYKDDRHMRDAAFEVATQTGMLDYTTRLMWRDGSLHWVRIKGNLTFDANGTPVRIRGIAQDITDQKELEAQKDSFLGIASHELKTPVTSIKAYAQVMELQFRKSGELMYAEMMGRIDKQINRLNFLISDLLDVTKIKSGKLQLNITEFDFDLLAREVVDDMQRISTRHTIIKRLNFGKMVSADRDRLNQVITNLISNAIKYSPNASQIKVYTQEEDGQVKLCVQDYGIGIREEMRDRVFEQFYRAGGNVEHKYPGLGLGLYISSEIVKRMNGRIWVEPGEEQGSIFSFTLPILK